MSDQDIVATFKALPQDRQRALLGRMTVEQKQKLTYAIQQKVQAKQGPAGGAGGSWDPDSGLAKAAKTGSDVLQGIGAGAISTVAGVGKFITDPIVKRVASPEAMKRSDENIKKLTATNNTAQSIGYGAENVGEFIGGEEAVKALSEAAKLKNIPTIAKFVKQYPTLAKSIISGLRSGGVGTAQSAIHGETNPISSGAVTGAFGAGGELAAGALGKLGPRASSKAYEAVNKYIGLNKSDLAKWERLNIKAPEEVAKTVLEKVGIKGGLEEQRAAIESVRAHYDDLAESMLQSPEHKLTNLHSIVNELEARTTRELELAGRPLETLNAAKKNAEAIKAAYGENALPDTLLKLRKELGKQIKWNALQTSTDVRQHFLADLYGEVNSAIKNSLPPDEAAKFSGYNQIQNRLITARDAVGEKMVTEALGKKGVGPVTKVLRTGAGAAVGFGVGVASGHPTVGVATGMAVPYMAGKIADIHMPAADIKSQTAIAKAAPKLERIASKLSPAAARAVMSAISRSSDTSAKPQQP